MTRMGTTTQTEQSGATALTADPDALATLEAILALPISGDAMTIVKLREAKLNIIASYGTARYHEGAEQMRDTAKLACKVKADEASRAGLTDIAKIYRDCQHMVSAFPLTPEGQ